MSTPIIRLIEQSDNETVAKIIRQVMTEFGAVGEGYSINDPEVDKMYETYEASKARFWVIELDGVIKGCGGFLQLKGEGNDDTCELQKMYFMEDLRGFGIGRKLLNLAIDTARELGFKTMYLETVARMTAANNLYKKNGFLPSEAQGCTGHSACDTFYTLAL